MRRKYPAEVLKENHEVAAIIFNAFGLFYGVMVAFVVFVTWSGYCRRTKNLEWKPARWTIFFIVRKHSRARPVQSCTRDSWIIRLLVYDELKAMQHGEIALHSTGVMPKLLTTFYQLDEKSVSNRELYAEH